MLDGVKKPHDEWRGALRKERFQVSHDLPPASPALARVLQSRYLINPRPTGVPPRGTGKTVVLRGVNVNATSHVARGPRPGGTRLCWPRLSALRVRRTSRVNGPFRLAARCMAASFGCIPHGARLHRGCVLRVCVGARGMSCWAQAGPAPCSFHLRAVPSRTPRGPRGPDNLHTHAEMAPGGQQPRLFRSRTRQKYLDFSTDERF